MSSTRGLFSQLLLADSATKTTFGKAPTYISFQIFLWHQSFILWTAKHFNYYNISHQKLPYTSWGNLFNPVFWIRIHWIRIRIQVFCWFLIRTSCCCIRIQSKIYFDKISAKFIIGNFFWPKSVISVCLLKSQQWMFRLHKHEIFLLFPLWPISACLDPDPITPPNGIQIQSGSETLLL